MIEIIIPGKPIAKKRPRFARRGKYVTTYNDQEAEEGKFLVHVRQQFDGQPFSCPLDVKMFCFMPRPKDHYGTGRNLGKLKKSAPVLPGKKPDIDNLVKFALDCMNDVVYLDDSQIVSILAVKAYGGTPKTIIQITEAT